MKTKWLLLKIANMSFKLTYWPICRFYSKYIIRDKPADALFRLLCSLQFRRVNGFWPDFVRPQYFSEKLWGRMLFDRNPKMTVISDKLAMRDYVTSKAGNEYLIKLLWRGNNPEEVPFDKLPMKYVIKTNHGCGCNILVKDNKIIDRISIKLQLKNWLKENFCQDKYLGTEWGYKNILPEIMVEEFIEENGKPPVDYKFYCFSGRVEFLTVHFDRFEEHKTRSFDRGFKPYDFKYDFEQWNGKCIRPANFTEMVNLAETLSQEFEFMRVDLYSSENKIYFSELTPYPGGVSTKFLPRGRDYILGKMWIKKNRMA